MIDQYTKLLMHFDGTAFLDECGHTVVNNSIVLNSTTRKFGSCSAYFDGITGHYLNIGNSSDFKFGNSDFTIEMWVYLTGALSSYNTLFTDMTDGNTWTNASILIKTNNSDGSIICYLTSNGSSANIANGINIGKITQNQWCHVALCRQGNNFYGFVNGVLGATITSSSTLYSNTANACIGGIPNMFTFNGYIDEVRISKGIARWTSNFTPPTYPYGVTEININNTNINIYPNVYRNKENKLSYQIVHPEVKKSFTEANSVASTDSTTLGSGKMFNLPIDQSKWANISNLIIK